MPQPELYPAAPGQTSNCWEAESPPTQHSPTGFSRLATRYRQRLALCRQLEEQLDFLQQRRAQLGSRQQTSKQSPGGGSSHTPQLRAVFPALNAQCRCLQERLRQQDALVIADSQALCNAIATLHDQRSAQILRYRFLELMRWDDISEITGLGTRWLQRVTKKSIEKLDIPDF